MLNNEVIERADMLRVGDEILSWDVSMNIFISTIRRKRNKYRLPCADREIDLSNATLDFKLFASD